ncbi:MAG: methyltransferase domain-containing protein [Desulfobacteraceae bacterium]
MEISKQWQLARGAAERYERILVPAILGPAAQALVDWTGLRDGESVVDVGCGTGAAAQGAAKKVGPKGRVAGVDLNPGMIDVARSIPPNSGAPIEWFEDNAGPVFQPSHDGLKVEKLGNPAQKSFPVSFCSARRGWAREPLR